MQLKKKYTRIIAVFLLLNFLNYTFFPLVSYALTAGPTAPEFSSFEPIDTTDMINIQSGDFTYSLPLLEVPGPEGGYPLSLSYHADIKPDEEASWVGLGFSLNPGAINRSVNGYADDNYNVTQKIIDYWDGGETYQRSFSLGISIPSTGISLNHSLVISDDTYKGFNGKQSIGIGFNPVTAIFNQVQASSLSKSFGGSTQNQLGAQAMGTMSNLFNIGDGVGVNISSSGTKAYASIGSHVFSSENSGGSNGHYYIKNLSNHTTPPILNMQLNLRKDYIRYWSDASTDISTFGSLYVKEGNKFINSDYIKGTKVTNYSSDSYSLYDINALYESDPNKQSGGSLPAYDDYTVLGQGIGGVIKPYIFENGDLYKQNIYPRIENGDLKGRIDFSNPEVVYESARKFSKGKVDFRFVNDFSNSLTINPSEIAISDMTANLHTVNAPAKGFNNTGEKQQLAGSKHIEWFTNEEIANGVAKSKSFVDYYNYQGSARKLTYEVVEDYLQPEMVLPTFCKSTYFFSDAGGFVKDQYPKLTNTHQGEETGNTIEYDPVSKTYKYTTCVEEFFKKIRPKQVDLRKKIGGFMVTNSSGVTYHYALPVYAYNEYTRTKLKEPEKGTSTFRETKNPEPYAYTWLLTAITGPDYVDKGATGLSDDDWGYWVKFDYGMWTDSYQWRSPHTGYHSDIESDSETFSYGMKELYYLDAIETKTHKAFFVKSIRRDGHGVTSRLEGGSKPREFDVPVVGYNNAQGNLKYSVSPVSTLKLDEIYLVKKEGLLASDFDKKAGNKYAIQSTAENPYPYKYYYTGSTIDNPMRDEHHPSESNVLTTADYVEVRYHNENLVLDDGDIAAQKDQLLSKALKVIQFQTDYSLGDAPEQAGVPNSFAYLSDIKELACTDKSKFDLVYPDRSNSSACIPDVCALPVPPKEAFEFYGMYPLQSYFNYDNGTCEDATKLFRGQDVKYYHLGKLSLKGVKVLGKGGADILPPTLFSYDYNPPYEPYKKDFWNSFKYDYKHFLRGENTRRTTPVSKEYVDAWSLTGITTSLGAKIKVAYESDDYSTSVLNPKELLTVNSVQVLSENTVQINLNDNNLDLENYFSVGDKLDFKYFIINQISNEGTTSCTNFVKVDSNIALPKRQINAENTFATDISIKEVINKEFRGVPTTALVVQSSQLYNQLISRVEARRCLDGPRESITYVNLKVSPSFITGFVEVQRPLPTYGGGLRVASLTLEDPSSGTSFSTRYDYMIPGTSKSSGVTSYSPYTLPTVKYSYELKEDETISKLLEDYRNAFQLIANRPVKKIIALASELPAPGVLYEYVTVRSFSNGIELPMYDRFRQEVFKEDFITNFDLVRRAYPAEEKEKRLLAVSNFANRIGSLKEATTYMSKTDEKLSETIYHYLHDGKNNQEYRNALATIQFNNQGVVQQAFHEYKKVKNKDNVYTHKGVVTKKEEYPTVAVGVTSKKFKTGIVTTTESLTFDFYSGVVTRTLNKDSYGNAFLTEVGPAHEHYPVMGLKIHNPANKHMLTQNATSATYKVNPDDPDKKLGLLSASVQTWSDLVKVLVASSQPGIYRKQASYHWNGGLELPNPGDGTYPIAGFEQFDFANMENNTNWEKTGEITLYDVYSHALEAKDINGNYAATRMDPKQQKVIASAGNASYAEMAYSGAEYYAGNDNEEGGVSRGLGTAIRAGSHTGQYSLLVQPGKHGFSYIIPADKLDPMKKYRASVWVYLPGTAETQAELDKLDLFYQVNGIEHSISPVVQKNKAGSWYLLNLDIKPEGKSNILISCRNNTGRGVYFDDFRVHPLNSSMTSFVYNTWGELSYILDANNFYTHYEYDAAGRLIRVSKERLQFDYGEGKESTRKEHVVKEVIYNYGNHQ